MASIGRSDHYWMLVAALGLMTLLLEVGCASARPRMDEAAKAQHPPDSRAESAKSLAPAPRVHTVPATKLVAKPDQSAAKKDGSGIELGSWPDWVIVAFTAFLAWLSWRQHELEKKLASDTAETLSVAKQSADAATAAANAANAQIQIAQKAFKIENRPWVGVVGEGVGSLEIRPDGVSRVAISLILQNSGRTPAHDVEVQARLIPENRHDGTVVDLVKRIRTANRNVELDAVTCFFPGEERSLEYSIESLPEYLSGSGDPSSGRALIFTLCGYVLYRSDSVEAGNMHASSFVYRIAKTNNRHIVWNGESITIAGFDLQMKRWPKGWVAD